MLEADLQTTANPEFVDPETVFGLPENLIMNPALANETKIAALSLWKHDLVLQMTATDENMPGRMRQSPYAPGESTAEMLRRVSNALLALDAGQTGPTHRT